MLDDELKAVLEANGAKLVGYGDMQDVPNCKYRYGVSVAINVPVHILKQLLEGPTKEYYEMYHELNSQLDEIIQAGVTYLQEQGYHAYGQTTDVVKKDEHWQTPVPHKTVATRAGLGWIGKSCLLVTPQYGSAIRLSSLLTDAPLTCQAPIDQSRCGACQVCVKACPAGALKGTLWNKDIDRHEIFDREKCKKKQTEIMKARTGIETDLCGQCFAVCPHTRKYLLSKQ